MIARLRPAAIAAVLAFTALHANAEGRLRLQADTSEDSDGLRSTVLRSSWTAPNGWGLGGLAREDHADGWTDHGIGVSAIYDNGSAKEPTSASLGAIDIAGHRRWLGSVDAMRPIAPGQSLGITASRDLVESALGLQQGLTVGTVGLVGDHEIGAHGALGWVAGGSAFSDGNVRRLLRTRWSWSLDETTGLNVYAKTRTLRHSDPHSPGYYSPARLEQYSAGASVRWRIASPVVLVASADAGRQHAEGVGQSIWSASAGLAAPRNAPVQWQLGWQASNAASDAASQTASYRYGAWEASVRLPF